MKIIEENIVNSTWEEVAHLSGSQASQRMVKLGDKQSDLLAFVMAYLEDLRQEATEVGLYVFYVVYRIFENSTNKKLKRISGNKIESAFKKNQEFLSMLDGVHDKFLERIAELETLSQPHVTQYVLDAIMESGEYEDPVFLTDEEIGSIFLVLKTVIDVLDNARNRSIRGL